MHLKKKTGFLYCFKVGTFRYVGSKVTGKLKYDNTHKVKKNLYIKRKFSVGKIIL